MTGIRSVRLLLTKNPVPSVVQSVVLVWVVTAALADNICHSASLTVLLHYVYSLSQFSQILSVVVPIVTGGGVLSVNTLCSFCSFEELAACTLPETDRNSFIISLH